MGEPELAIDGGTPVRSIRLPYGRQWVSEDDIAAVVEVLRSDWLTTGPAVTAFERGLAEVVGARQVVAVSNGTAALHATMYALGIGPGDEVIVPAMTFAATANCVVFQGGVPVFADVTADTLLLDPASVVEKITPRTKAIIAVDYAGQPCNYESLRALADRHGLALVADACHALGARYRERPVGTLAELTVFSFHPVKHITTGEGGAVATDDTASALRMRRFRNHGITTEHHQREERGAFYEMVDLGYNYRISDLQCALGLRQLARLPEWLARRHAIARRYDAALSKVPAVEPLRVSAEVSHAYHLYVVRLKVEELRADRDLIVHALRAEGIGVNVHYIPVHLHPFFRQRFHTGPGQCQVAEDAYRRIVTLPIFPKMTDEDVDDVIRALDKVLGHYAP